jgi:hypothetical protein
MQERINPAYPLASRRMTELGSLVVPNYRERLCWHHKQIAEACEGLIRYTRYQGRRGGFARACISLPPREGKSLHGRELLPALALGQDPNLKIIATSRGTELAKEGLSHTRQFMNHPDYKRTFSTRFGAEMEVDERGRERKLQATDKATLFRALKPRDPENPRGGYEEAQGYYLAQGMDASLTGWGYDIGIIDDLIKNDNDAMSPTFHSRMWTFYTSTFATRGESPFAAQLYIGTRWTEPDFADELVEYWEEELQDRSLIKVLRFSALAEEPIAEGDPRAVDEGLGVELERRYIDQALPKGAKTTEFYQRQKRALEKLGQKWVWDGLWQQRPNMAGIKLFQPAYWLSFGESFDLDKLWCIDFSIDPNLSEKGQSFAVIAVTGVMMVDPKAGEDAGEHYFKLDEGRGHWSLPDMEAELERLYAKWDAALGHAMQRGSIWVEDKALGPTLISKYSHKYPIEAVAKANNKLACWRLAATITEKKRMRIPVGTWGRDPTNPKLPLITDEWVGSITTKGSWVHEMASHGKPNDRRDAEAQQIICRDRLLGKHLLNIR